MGDLSLEASHPRRTGQHGPSALDGASPADQVHHEDDHCHHEEQVNQPPADVEAETEQPHHRQDHDNRPQHNISSNPRRLTLATVSLPALWKIKPSLARLLNAMSRGVRAQPTPGLSNLPPGLPGFDLSELLTDALVRFRENPFACVTDREEHGIRVYLSGKIPRGAFNGPEDGVL
jgi:hypothetical protein